LRADPRSRPAAARRDGEAPDRPAGEARDGARAAGGGAGVRGPIVFWSLILLVILGVFALFRALASHPAGARVAAASPVASPQPGATAPGGVPAWGGKPLQARVKRTGV